MLETKRRARTIVFSIEMVATSVSSDQKIRLEHVFSDGTSTARTTISSKNTGWEMLETKRRARTTVFSIEMVARYVSSD